jgi:hypothetical protein
MKLKDTLKFMTVLFCVITTGQVVFVASFNLLYDSEAMFSMWDLLKMPAVALAGVMPTLLFVRSETAPRAELIVRNALHFVLTAGIVFGLLFYFGWIDDIINAAIVLAFFLAIYIPAHVVAGIQEKKLADRLNERISAFYRAENETHRDEP